MARMDTSIERASDLLTQTVISEVEFEVDHDERAINQIQKYTAQLQDGFRLRVGRLVERTSTNVSNKLRQAGIPAGPVKEDSVASLPSFDVQSKDGERIREIVDRLKDTNLDALNCCMCSRSFRCEIVYHMIVGSISKYRVQFETGLSLLMQSIQRFKGKEVARPEYVRNVELRVSHLESIYAEAFGKQFAQEFPVETEVDHLDVRLGNCISDMQDIKDYFESVADSEQAATKLSEKAHQVSQEIQRQIDSVQTASERMKMITSGTVFSDLRGIADLVKDRNGASPHRPNRP